MEKALRAAGLDFQGNAELKITQHDLRRTAASRMANQGESPLVVAKLLGHASASSVTEIYSRISDDTVAKALEESNAALRKAMRRKVPKRLPAAGRQVLAKS